jgi:hypothetical protein
MATIVAWQLPGFWGTSSIYHTPVFSISQLRQAAMTIEDNLILSNAVRMANGDNFKLRGVES